MSAQEQNFQIVVKALPDLVKLEFGMPIDKFGLRPDQAEALANTILKAAADARKTPAPVSATGLTDSDFVAAVTAALDKAKYGA